MVCYQKKHNVETEQCNQCGFKNHTGFIGLPIHLSCYLGRKGLNQIPVIALKLCDVTISFLPVNTIGKTCSLPRLQSLENYLPVFFSAFFIIRKIAFQFFRKFFRLTVLRNKRSICHTQKRGGRHAKERGFQQFAHPIIGKINATQNTYDFPFIAKRCIEINQQFRSNTRLIRNGHSGLAGHSFQKIFSVSGIRGSSIRGHIISRFIGVTNIIKIRTLCQFLQILHSNLRRLQRLSKPVCHHLYIIQRLQKNIVNPGCGLCRTVLHIIFILTENPLSVLLCEQEKQQHNNAYYNCTSCNFLNCPLFKINHTYPLLYLPFRKVRKKTADARSTIIGPVAISV